MLTHFRCSLLKRCNNTFSISRDNRFRITYKLTPTRRWSNTMIHASGNIIIIFLSFFLSNSTYMYLESPWSDCPRELASTKRSQPKTTRMQWHGNILYQVPKKQQMLKKISFTMFPPPPSEMQKGTTYKEASMDDVDMFLEPSSMAT